MGVNDDALAKTALGLSEDSKAARKRKGAAKDETPFLTDYTLDETQRENLGFAMATKDDTQREEEVAAFWRAAGDRGQFRHMTVEPAKDVLVSGAFRALAIEGDTGLEGSDVSEEAANLAIERMENLAQDAVFSKTTAVQDLRDLMLDIVKSRPKPWSLTPPGEQRDVAAALLHGAEEAVRKIVEAVVSGGAPKSVRALLTKITITDKIVATLEVKAFTPAESNDAVIALNESHGKHVIVAVASKDDHSTDRDAEVDEEEPALDFSAGD